MVKVCKSHVKDIVCILDTPHVQRVKNSKDQCSICNKEAEYHFFYRNPLQEYVLALKVKTKNQLII
ncbi:hypothetical protein AUL54_16305 [Bacillus sp. SDLI1]|uniref:Uncharacterized protein n=1 Tax=Bacillus siamensis TaxID=659243 RepID=A0AAI8HLU0_9BACI|nr:hypothetical protein AUL54_16305 [Bacillus sp. SDLI1]AUJ76372.1 hypothetical protein CWD84_05955 [Bacillus siamensis]